MLGSNFFELMW